MPGEGLVALDRRHQVVGAVADVSHLGRHRRRHLVLDEGVPLVRELRAQLGVEGPHVPGGRRARNEVREARGDRARSGRLVVVDVRLEEERRVERQPQVGAGAFHELRDAVAAAQHEPVGDTPGDSEREAPSRCSRGCRAPAARGRRPPRRSDGRCPLPNGAGRSKFDCRFSCSTSGDVYAQRSPRFSVRSGVTRKSSCTKRPIRFCRWVQGSPDRHPHGPCCPPCRAGSPRRPSPRRRR